MINFCFVFTRWGGASVGSGTAAHIFRHGKFPIVDDSQDINELPICQLTLSFDEIQEFNQYMNMFTLFSRHCGFKKNNEFGDVY